MDILKVDCVNGLQFEKINYLSEVNENRRYYREDNNVGGCLSYVTRIAKGYTLIAVDTGKYSSDQTNSGLDIQETGGTISQPLLNWIRKIILRLIICHLQMNC